MSNYGFDAALDRHLRAQEAAEALFEAYCEAHPDEENPDDDDVQRWGEYMADAAEDDAAERRADADRDDRWFD